MAAKEWSSVLTKMVADKTQEVRKMKGSNSQAPQGSTCLRWEWTMILYLSNAMVMMVREDMKTAMQGKVLTSLERYNIYCEFIFYFKFDIAKKIPTFYLGFKSYSIRL